MVNVVNCVLCVFYHEMNKYVKLKNKINFKIYFEEQSVHFQEHQAFVGDRCRHINFSCVDLKEKKFVKPESFHMTFTI